MRLRRLELMIIALTLAFACFMGGFFTGRSWSSVNIIAAPPLQSETFIPEVQTPLFGGQASVNPGSVTAEAPDGAAGTSSESSAGQTSEAVGAPRGGDGKININLASQSELMDLPGIGSVLASRIVDYRRQHGGFSRIEDIRNVSGIGEKRFDTIKDRITV